MDKSLHAMHTLQMHGALHQMLHETHIWLMNTPSPCSVVQLNMLWHRGTAGVLHARSHAQLFKERDQGTLRLACC